MLSILARPWPPSVRIGICQPSQERAVTLRLCSASASRPDVICSPAAATVSYSRASWSAAAARTHLTTWSVVPAMAETTTATLSPASAAAFTRSATTLMRSRSASDVPPYLWTMRAIGWGCARAGEATLAGRGDAPTYWLRPGRASRRAGPKEGASMAPDEHVQQSPKAAAPDEAGRRRSRPQRGSGGGRTLRRPRRALVGP